MNRDKVPLVTTLLRASRSQDEDTLRQVLENIIRNGISEAELNAEDCSGRVSEMFVIIKLFTFLIACVEWSVTTAATAAATALATVAVAPNSST